MSRLTPAAVRAARPVPETPGQLDLFGADDDAGADTTPETTESSTTERTERNAA